MPDIAAVKRTLRGPMIPVITNLKDDLSIDQGAIVENVRFVIDRGVTRGQGVLLAVGAGGDFPMLTLDERKAVARTIVEAAEGRVPVVMGAQDTNPTVSIELARWAEEIGADAIQLSAGYYYPSSHDDCLRFFRAVHDATTRIGIMIYNTHWEGYNLTLDQVARLAELPRCVSLKWSTPDGGHSYLGGVHRFADRFAVVDNQGLAVLNHMLGGAGFVSHLATIWPEHQVGVWKLLEAGDYVSAQRMQTAAKWPWSEFRGKMFIRTAAESPVVKAALDLCGRPGGPNRLPVRSLDAEERSELRDLLAQIGVPHLV